ncbi:hypothetical protein A0H81_00877 [Grifola frondosa]|uniref:Uncharacterized protein n=1 Tax=Grifola frondosa TaxID=5627 RepID=A0A1C7MPX4_GRIFR|nr:hypothetical protein A0H81_00877 [Grifola frondosa]
MSNRRDNGDRKGRGSNKENRDVKEASTSSCAGMGGHDDPEDDTQESVYDTFPGEWQNAPYSSSSLDNPQLQEQPDEDSKIVQEPSATEPFFTLDRNSQFLAGLNFSSTPPVTPGLSPMKSVNDVPSNIILESPYNPSATPSFRHSPARLPIDQPWRFLSPSHPLHSTREVSLAMLVHGEESPIVHGFDSSPVVVAPKSEFQGKGIFGSPFVPGAGSKETASDLDAMFSFADSSPRRFFCETPVAFTDRAEFKKHRIPESPLGRGLSGKKNRSLAWVSDVSLTPLNGRVGTGAGLMEPIQLQGEDPFAAEGLYDSWIDLTGEADGSIENVVEDPIESSQETSPPESSNEGDSPVLRRSQSSQMSVNSSGGRSHFSGPGLMDAVLSKSKSRRRKSNAADSTANHGEEAQASGSGVSMGSPFKPGKKTRRDFLSGLLEGDAGTCEMQDALQPKKRRKTVTGHD